MMVKPTYLTVYRSVCSAWAHLWVRSAGRVPAPEVKLPYRSAISVLASGAFERLSAIGYNYASLVLFYYGTSKRDLLGGQTTLKPADTLNSHA